MVLVVVPDLVNPVIDGMVGAGRVDDDTMEGRVVGTALVVIDRVAAKGIALVLDVAGRTVLEVVENPLLDGAGPKFRRMLLSMAAALAQSRSKGASAATNRPRIRMSAMRKLANDDKRDHASILTAAAILYAATFPSMPSTRASS